MPYHILSADSAAARLFETAGVNQPLFEIGAYPNPTDHSHERDLLTSRPGRVFNRSAGIHQALAPPTNVRKQELAHWVRSLERPVLASLNERGSDGLILVAAPRLLALLGETFGAGTRVRGRYARNLARLSLDDLRERMQPLLRTISAERRFEHRPALIP